MTQWFSGWSPGTLGAASAPTRGPSEMPTGSLLPSGVDPLGLWPKLGIWVFNKFSDDCHLRPVFRSIIPVLSGDLSGSRAPGAGVTSLKPLPVLAWE